MGWKFEPVGDDVARRRTFPLRDLFLDASPVALRNSLRIVVPSLERGSDGRVCPSGFIDFRTALCLTSDGFW